MSRGVDTMISQGVTYCRTFVDADNIVKLLPINAALTVKSLYAGRIHLEIGVQPLKGVLEPESCKYFSEACIKADYIGGLPSRDRPTPERHLDYVLQLGRDLNKPVDVHVDQENNPEESETELLALKTMQYGLGGRVNAIHAISLAAKPERERKRIIEMMKDAGLGIVVCPSAGLSMKQLTKTAPLHNSIAPVPELLEAGVAVYLGVDNIYDLFMPFTDGDLWFEARMLMEACRFYDIDAIARVACRRPACGLAPAGRAFVDRVPADTSMEEVS
jgi:cytosine deaminase